jgi:hypothetical protein
MRMNIHYIASWPPAMHANLNFNLSSRTPQSGDPGPNSPHDVRRVGSRLSLHSAGMTPSATVITAAPIGMRRA